MTKALWSARTVERPMPGDDISVLMVLIGRISQSMPEVNAVTATVLM